MSFLVNIFEAKIAEVRRNFGGKRGEPYSSRALSILGCARSWLSANMFIRIWLMLLLSLTYNPIYIEQTSAEIYSVSRFLCAEDARDMTDVCCISMIWKIVRSRSRSRLAAHRKRSTHPSDNNVVVCVRFQRNNEFTKQISLHFLNFELQISRRYVNSSYMIFLLLRRNKTRRFRKVMSRAVLSLKDRRPETINLLMRSSHRINLTKPI